METRRKFGKQVLATPILGLLGAEAAQAQAPNANDSLQSQAQNLTEAVRAKFGRFLNEEDLKKIYQRLGGGLVTAETLHRVPLDNSEEPAIVFEAD